MEETNLMTSALLPAFVPLACAIWLEFETNAVDTVSETSWIGTIVKHMTKMGITLKEIGSSTIILFQAEDCRGQANTDLGF